MKTPTEPNCSVCGRPIAPLGIVLHGIPYCRQCELGRNKRIPVMKLNDLTKEEAERISKFLTEELGLRECWHEWESEPVKGKTGLSFWKRCKGQCGVLCPFGDERKVGRNPSILDADFREEVMEGWRSNGRLSSWWATRQEQYGDGRNVLIDTLTDPNKWVFMILKEMGYE